VIAGFAIMIAPLAIAFAKPPITLALSAIAVGQTLFCDAKAQTGSSMESWFGSGGLERRQQIPYLIAPVGPLVQSATPLPPFA